MTDLKGHPGWWILNNYILDDVVMSDDTKWTYGKLYQVSELLCKQSERIEELENTIKIIMALKEKPSDQ